LLAEDLTANSMPSVDSQQDGRSDSAVTHKSEHYGDAEFLENQLRLTDLVPRRMLSALLLLAVGVAVIGCLVMLYVAAPKIIPTTAGGHGIAALGKPGGLGNWVASLLLLQGSFFALVVYTIRRHKVDDYHGRYRVWLWAAACCFLMATDAAAGLHSTFQQALVAWTHSRIVGDGSIWWIAPSILLIGWVAVRLLIDMRPSRLSTAAIVLAAIAYFTALTASSTVVRMPSETARSAFVYISLLGGHLLLAWSMALHARFVLLDAEGRLPRRAIKEKAKSKRAVKSKRKGKNVADAEPRDCDSNAAEPESNAPDDTWVAVDPPHGNAPTGPSVLKRVPLPIAQTEQSLAQEAEATSSENASSSASSIDGKLSKAERKALKKKQIEERLKSEQRRASNW
jgi:hypothetical protein